MMETKVEGFGERVEVAVAGEGEFGTGIQNRFGN